jgi:LysM repeat protein
MATRSPARFLAPLALLAVVVALWMIVSHSTSGGDSGGGATTTQQKATATPGAKSASKKKSSKPRTYVVKPGDTPSGIAEKTGVSLSTLEELNPDMNPQALAPGTKLKLRR